jgi:hypothetical protein
MEPGGCTRAGPEAGSRIGLSLWRTGYGATFTRSSAGIATGECAPM